ncbi:MAG TPA: phosphatase domain-containing protein [Thermoanaerobaculia bacterium]
MSDRRDSDNPRWKSALLGLADPAERGYDAVKRRLSGRFDRDDPVQILPYRGFGTSERALLSGRVLQNEPVGAAGEKDSVWKNLGNMWKRFESDEVPHARLRAGFRGWSGEVVADEEGYFRIEARPAAPPEPGRLWHDLDLELLDPAYPGVRATGSVLVPPQDAEFGVISDIDDTVVETGVTKRLVMARTVFLGNARTRLPFKGVAAFYDALCQGVTPGCNNPIFFVSSSPWNLYDLLIEFMELQSIPRGPLLLRDFGLDRRKLFHAPSPEHKLRCIRPILDLYSHLRFILIGDSGEQDPEIYRQVVREYPGRILAIYIRRIGTALGRDDRVLELAKEIRDEGVPMLLVPDTEAAAVHAADSGWIRWAKVPEVHEEKVKDETAPSPTEVALKTDAGAGPSSGPS